MKKLAFTTVLIITSFLISANGINLNENIIFNLTSIEVNNNETEEILKYISGDGHFILNSDDNVATFTTSDLSVNYHVISKKVNNENGTQAIFISLKEFKTSIMSTVIIIPKQNAFAIKENSITIYAIIK